MIHDDKHAAISTLSSWFRDLFTATVVPTVIFFGMVQGSEHRHPVWNLLWSLMFLAAWCPSGVAAVLRPKRMGMVRRLLSGRSELWNDENNGGITRNDDPDQRPITEGGIGGGRINEKMRTFRGPSDNNGDEAIVDATQNHYEPSKKSAHLYHALEGLDRYPNYLARWNAEDIDRLEESLEEKLTIVRNQRETVQARHQSANQLVQALLRSERQNKDSRWERFLKRCETWDEVRERILHPQAAKAIFSSKMFQARRNNTVPSVEDVVSGQISVEIDPGRLETLLDEELYDVYSFRLLSDDFCNNLREFVRELAVLSEAEDGTNFGKRPFNLDMIGLDWVNDLLFHLVMRPISRQLFLESEDLQKDLDWRNGYIAGYSAKPGAGKPRERLVTHTDDSEVTLNVCLGDIFEGGLLEFRGLRGTPEEGQLLGEFQPQQGLALIHAGRHFHDVTQVTSGDRFAYIMWARSWAGIRAQTCPCCWLNRRQGTDCVCGSRWN